jgi:hypothetical protein
VTGQSKTCRALAEGVRQPLDGARLVKCSEKFRTLQEDTSSERCTDDLDLDVFAIRPRQEPKTDENQVQKTSDWRRELRRHSSSLYNQGTADKSHMTPTMCAQSATPTNMWLQMLQEPKKEGRHLTMRNRSTMTSLPVG